MTPLLQVNGLRFAYPHGAAMAFPDFALGAAEVARLVGPSGTGKSTLLLLLAGLKPPAAGRALIAGTDPAVLGTRARDRWRGRTLGVVLQDFALPPRLTVTENLEAARYFAGLPRDAALLRGTLEALGLSAHRNTPCGQLSRGQRQRAAIARAIVNRPALILADEPTSSLDDAAAEAALGLLLSARAQLGAGLIIATHDARLAPAVPRAIALTAAA